MYEIKATYKGITPQMHDRFYNIEETVVGKRKAKNIEITDEEVFKKLHCDKKGVYLPADNIRMMLIGNQMRRGASTILGSDIEKSKGTKYKSICTASIWVAGPENPLKVYLEPNRKTYDDIDERAFPTMKGKGGCSRKITRRPILNLPWSLSFVIQVTDDSIDETFVSLFFDVAGLRCGCGAYGPTFGRCLITEWSIRK